MLFPLSPLLHIPPLSSPDIPLHLLHHNVFEKSGAPSSSLLIGTASKAIEQSINPLGGVSLSVFLSPETALEPINEASEVWVRGLVWTDFRVAVAFFVVIPLLLLAWAVALRVPPTIGGDNDNDNDDPRPPIAETVLRIMTSYWQASSLLLLTVLLNVQESRTGVFTGLLAQAMIVVSLYWWQDLGDELDEEASSSSREPIYEAFSVWRTLAGAAASVGVLIQLPFQGCLAVPSLSGDAVCAPWLEPPRFAAGLVGDGLSPTTLGTVAAAGCSLYALVAAYYVVVLLPSVGRRGRASRPELMDFATPTGVWIALGFLDPQEPSEE